VTLQGVEREPAYVEKIGGSREVLVDLYRADGTPAWLQDRHYIPNADVQNFGFRFPFWHDAVKIALPGIDLSSAQAIDEGAVSSRMLLPTERLFIVGYPHGYSALDNPTPIVLTAHIAALRFGQNRQELLLDRAGAPGMSGSPVFLEDEIGLRLIGIYTGVIRPAGSGGISLGTCADMRLCWGNDMLAFVTLDSPALEPLDSEGNPVLAE
jgi:hypothetical protein